MRALHWLGGLLVSLLSAIPRAGSRRDCTWNSDERVPTTDPLLPAPTKRPETATLSDPWAIALLGRGFVQTSDGAVLTQGGGEIFVPLNRPGALELEVGIEGASGELTWASNGHRTAGPPFRIDGDWVDRGINLLAVSGGGLTIRELTLAEGREWPPPWATAYPSSRP